MTPPRITRLGGYGSTLRWAIKMALLAAAVTNCFLHHYLGSCPVWLLMATDTCATALTRLLELIAML